MASSSPMPSGADFQASRYCLRRVTVQAPRTPCGEVSRCCKSRTILLRSSARCAWRKAPRPDNPRQCRSLSVDWRGIRLFVMRFRVDFERGENTRVHVVEADQHGQLNDLALVEMRP